jgi:hypothetical protein
MAKRLNIIVDPIPFNYPNLFPKMHLGFKQTSSYLNPKRIIFERYIIFRLVGKQLNFALKKLSGILYHLQQEGAIFWQHRW